MPTSYLLIIAFVCACIGFLLSFLFRTLTADRAPSVEDRLQPADSPDTSRADQVTFYKEHPGDRWLLEIDNKVVGSAIELNPDQRDRVEQIALDLKAWLGYPPSAATSFAPAAGNVPAFTSTEAMDSLSTDLAVQLPLAKPVAAAPVEAKSIVSQIDDILQDHIAGTNLAGRGIRLMELPKKGVVVSVGLDQYPEISAVPDPEIRAAIQSAVAEWEKKAK